jgi:hypothetical protein
MDVNKRKVNYLMKMKKISKENAEPEVQEDEEPEPAEERDVQEDEEAEPAEERDVQDEEELDDLLVLETRIDLPEPETTERYKYYAVYFYIAFFI